VTRLTEARARRPLRPLVAIGFATAGVTAAIGAFLPMSHVPSGPGWAAFMSMSIVETFGWSPLALPVLLLATTIAEAVRPGRARWAPLVLGAMMTLAAFAWGAIDWVSLNIGEIGARVPGTTIGLDAVPGIWLYGGGGLVAMTLGALLIVAPRRMCVTTV